MHPTDRLAAYLADELRADERAQLEAALANDPELRRTLAALRRADDALVQLESPAPADGFDARLDAVIDATLADTLASSDQSPNTRTDELAARRGPWAHPRTLGALAAGLILIVGGIVVTQQLGTDDVSVETSADAPELFADESDQPAADLDAPASEDSAAQEGLEADADHNAAFLLVDDDRVLDRDDLDELLDTSPLWMLSAEQLDERSAADYAARLTDGLRLTGPTGGTAAADSRNDAADADGASADEEPAADSEEPATGGEEPADSAASDPDAQSAASDLPPYDAADGSAAPTPARAQEVSRCLEGVLTGGTAAVPGYAELATVDGRRALVLGVLVEDPATGIFDGRQVWVMDRASCEVVDIIRNAD